MRFKETMITVKKLLEAEGEECYLPEFEAKAMKHQLRRMHFGKIDTSDSILVVDRHYGDETGSYIGDDTRLEIAYAISQRKDIIFLSNNMNKKSGEPIRGL